MWTRKTALRVAFAEQLYRAGNAAAARYALPRKWKVWWCDPRVSPLVRGVMRQTLEVLRHSFMPLRISQGGTQIGQTIVIRKPARFITKEKL